MTSNEGRRKRARLRWLDGNPGEALRITIVIKPGAARQLGGDAVLDTLVGVQERLQEMGEQRFPIIEYATERELKQGASAQP